MIKPAYSVSFLLSINIFVWQNVLYLIDAPRIIVTVSFLDITAVQLLGDITGNKVMDKYELKPHRKKGCCKKRGEIWGFMWTNTACKILPSDTVHNTW